ncbi:hypothetical protein C7S14_3247 [Burkholderia cepacia]|nr:hypothetical protein C7S14_3247 [Burkholderia cepacia]
MSNYRRFVMGVAKVRVGGAWRARRVERGSTNSCVAQC